MNTNIHPSIDLKQAVSKLDSLPAMPIIARKLLGLKLDTDQDEQQMLLLIAQDPLISARIIGLANSPLFGSSRKISTVKDASLLLGLKRVKSVATGLALLAQVNKPVGRLNIPALWEHNMGVAFAMLAIVSAMPAKMRINDDLTFLAGMLHDVGYSVLAHLDVERSDELQTRMVTEPNRLAVELELEVVGLTHDELGAELARHWDLPEEIVAAIRFHHAVHSSDSAQPLARIINLAERLLPSSGFSERIDTIVAPEDWLALGIDPEHAEDIIVLVAEQAEQASQFASSFS
ncbi:MAG TPA: HDOD domain-containing protein [Gallionella sp.]|nr:HDOD domain-containing protein [Gallionella sp.]HUW76619.1 HDOD domain-containing protein [Gallionella sp.]